MFLIILFLVLLAMGWSELSFRTWCGFLLAGVAIFAVCTTLDLSAFVFVPAMVILDSVLVLAVYGSDIWLRYN